MTQSEDPVRLPPVQGDTGLRPHTSLGLARGARPFTAGTNPSALNTEASMLDMSCQFGGNKGSAVWAVLSDREQEQYHRWMQKRLVNGRTRQVSPYVKNVKMDRYYWDGRHRPIVDKLHPKEGDVGGGTRVELLGRGFKKGDDIKVIFVPVGDAAKSAGANEVEAMEVSLTGDRTVSCVTQGTGVHGKFACILEVNGVRSRPDPKNEVFNKVFIFKGPIVHDIIPRMAMLKGGGRAVVHGLCFGDGLGESPEVLIDGMPCDDVRYELAGKRLSVEIPPGRRAGKVSVQVWLTTSAGTVLKSYLTPFTKTLFEYSNEADAVKSAQESKFVKLPIEKSRVDVDVADLFHSPEKAEDTMRVLTKNIALLGSVYWHYSLICGTVGEDDPTNISKRQFKIFCEDTRIFGDDAVGPSIPFADQDTVFARVNREYGSEKESANAIEYHEFLGAVCRLADKKYSALPTVKERVEKFIGNHVVPFSKKLNRQHGILTALASQDVQNLIFFKDGPFRMKLEKIFFEACHGDRNGRLMDFNELCALLVKHKIIKEELALNKDPSIPHLRRIFFLCNLGRWIKRKPGSPCPCLGLCECEIKADAVRCLDVDKVKKEAERESQSVIRRSAKMETMSSVQQLGVVEFLEFIGRLALHIRMPTHIDDPRDDDYEDIDTDALIRDFAQAFCNGGGKLVSISPTPSAAPSPKASPRKSGEAADLDGGEDGHTVKEDNAENPDEGGAVKATKGKQGGAKTKAKSQKKKK